MAARGARGVHRRLVWVAARVGAAKGGLSFGRFWEHVRAEPSHPRERNGPIGR